MTLNKSKFWVMVFYLIHLVIKAMHDNYFETTYGLMLAAFTVYIFVQIKLYICLSI